MAVTAWGKYLFICLLVFRIQRGTANLLATTPAAIQLFEKKREKKYSHKPRGPDRSSLAIENKTLHPQTKQATAPSTLKRHWDTLPLRIVPLQLKPPYPLRLRIATGCSRGSNSSCGRSQKAVSLDADRGVDSG